MGVLKKFKVVLLVVLVTIILWVGLVIFLNLTSAELRAELLRSKNVYEFLGKGMLDEVKIVIEDDDGVEIEGASFDLLQPIEPFFSKTGYENIAQKIREELLVPPQEFHDLQNDAVMRKIE